jgi:hypothetical protein
MRADLTTRTHDKEASGSSREGVCEEGDGSGRRKDLSSHAVMPDTPRDSSKPRLVAYNHCFNRSLAPTGIRRSALHDNLIAAAPGLTWQVSDSHVHGFLPGAG